MKRYRVNKSKYEAFKCYILSLNNKVLWQAGQDIEEINPFVLNENVDELCISVDKEYRSRTIYLSWCTLDKVDDFRELDNTFATVEKVNHPQHYNSGKYEAIEIIEDNGWGKGFCLGNAVKYILRAEHKGNEIEDLKKAVWYLNRYIQKMDK